MQQHHGDERVDWEEPGYEEDDPASEAEAVKTPRPDSARSCSCRAEWLEPGAQDSDRKSGTRRSGALAIVHRRAEYHAPGSQSGDNGQTDPPESSPRDGQGSAWAMQRDLAAKEREVLTSVLEQCTSKIESDLRDSLRVHRSLLEDMIFSGLQQLRFQESRGDAHHMEASPPPFKGFDPQLDSDSVEPSGVDLADNAEGEEEEEEDDKNRPSQHPEDEERVGNRNATAIFRHNHYSKALVTRMRKVEAFMHGRKDGSLVSSTGSTSPELEGRGTRLLPRAATSFFNPEGCIHGTVFNLLSAALIVGNAAFIGVQTHLGMKNELRGIDSRKEELSWDLPELLFLGFFTAELGIRIFYDRLHFLRGVEWRWNLFDSIIVGISLVEVVAASILDGIGLSFPFLRLVRVVRVLRVLKVLHMIPLLKRLGLMMSSVAASLSALAPAFVLLILVIYMFGICVMQGVINHLQTNTIEHKEAWLVVLEDRLGGLLQTMETLFMSITGGLSWVEVLDGLNQIDGFYNLVYMFYVGFVQICVLNIVTGVFVDTVHQMYQPERDEMVERETTKRKVMLQNLKSLLEEADADGSGTITWEEFESFTSDIHIKMYLAAHEIDITQAREIFQLIDKGGEGQVSIDEFVLSFLEFKGAAKGADVVILRNDVAKVHGKLTRFMVESSNAMEDLMAAIEGRPKQPHSSLQGARSIENLSRPQTPNGLKGSGKGGSANRLIRSMVSAGGGTPNRGSANMPTFPENGPMGGIPPT